MSPPPKWGTPESMKEQQERIGALGVCIFLAFSQGIREGLALMIEAAEVFVDSMKAEGAE